MRVLDYGPSAVLVELASVDEAMAMYDAARASSLVVTDLVPAARTVLFDGTDVAVVKAWLPTELAPVTKAMGRLVELPTTYDGPDLADVATRWGMTPDALVELHASTQHRVAFCGFAPGFAYCTGLGRSVPRLDSPRARVPAGSVGLAGEFTGIYPTASPGGWRLIGRTDAALWDLTREPPGLLQPGDRVRFLAVDP